MFSYGIKLVGPDANISRAAGDPSVSGPTFPSDPTNGQLWQLTAVVGQNQIGTYVYSTARTSWVLQLVDFQPYDVGLSMLRRYAADSEVARYLSVRSTIIHKNFEGSSGMCDVVPAANTTFAVKIVNGDTGTLSTIGNFTFAAGQRVATFVAVTPNVDIVLIAGDQLKVFAPSTVDTTITNIAVTIAGRLIS